MLMTLSTNFEQITNAGFKVIEENIKAMAKRAAVFDDYEVLLVDEPGRVKVDVTRKSKGEPLISLYAIERTGRIEAIVCDFDILRRISAGHIAGIPNEDFVSLLNRSKLTGARYQLFEDDLIFLLDLKYKDNVESLNQMLLGRTEYIRAEFNRDAKRHLQQVLYWASNNNCRTFQELGEARTVWKDITAGDLLEVIEKDYPGVTQEINLVYRERKRMSQDSNRRYLNRLLVELENTKITRPQTYNLMGGEAYEDEVIKQVKESILLASYEIVIKVDDLVDDSIRAKVEAMIKEVDSTEPETKGEPKVDVFLETVRGL